MTIPEPNYRMTLAGSIKLLEARQKARFFDPTETDLMEIAAEIYRAMWIAGPSDLLAAGELALKKAPDPRSFTAALWSDHKRDGSTLSFCVLPSNEPVFRIGYPSNVGEQPPPPTFYIVEGWRRP